MLSQFDNEHNNRIRRSKSATSVKERRKRPLISEPVNPESSRVQALIAAHRAMDRSRDLSSDELRRTDSSVSKQSARLAASRNPKVPPAEQLRRQRSILQATTSNMAGSLPLPDSRNLGRAGHTSYTQTHLSEFGAGYDGSPDGEPSSFRRLRKVRSVLNTSRG